MEEWPRAKSCTRGHPWRVSGARCPRLSSLPSLFLSRSLCFCLSLALSRSLTLSLSHSLSLRLSHPVDLSLSLLISLSICAYLSLSLSFYVSLFMSLSFFIYTFLFSLSMALGVWGGGRGTGRGLQEMEQVLFGLSKHCKEGNKIQNIGVTFQEQVHLFNIDGSYISTLITYIWKMIYKQLFIFVNNQITVNIRGCCWLFRITVTVLYVCFFRRLIV